MKLLYILAAAVLYVSADETPVLREFKAGNVQFTAKTYKELASQNVGKNILVCPMSVSVILALVEAGAGGNTAQQLITGLSLPDTEAKIHEAFKTIAPGLSVDDKYTLSSANKVYLNKGFTIKSEFKDIATNVFKADVTDIDFSNKAAAAATMNKWVLDQTHDKIKDLISEDDLDAYTKAVLINALYFHGHWDTPFYNTTTTEKTFKVSSTKDTKVMMMEQTSRFNYFEDTALNAKFLEMTYQNSPISMIFVLPNDVDGLSALEPKIEKILETPTFSYEKVHVQIPRVHVEEKIDFVPILQKLGVKDAFGDSANFARLSDTPVTISKVIQKTFIDIEEKGTTAAAATAVLFKLTSAPYDPPTPIKEFEANHPFIFVLKSPSGILFVGRYSVPEN